MPLDKTSRLAADTSASDIDRRCLIGSLHPLFRRLKVAIAWQWNFGVLRREASNYIEGLSDVFANAISVIIGGIMAVICWPVVILWRFTGGMIWVAFTTPEDIIAQLEAISARNRDEGIKAAVRVAADHEQK